MSEADDMPYTDGDIQLARAAIPLWHAKMAWAKELLKRSFKLDDARDIMRPAFRGRQIPGTTWFYYTHRIGVDVSRASEVGGIDFDFDKPNPERSHA